jgi:hypothetical protein
MSRSTFFLSRSRFLKSRFSVETLSRRDFCRDCQDVSRLSRFVETHGDFRDLSRRCRDLSRPCRDLSRNFDIVEAFWVWKWWKVSTDWEISTRKYKNPCTSWSRSRQTVEKRQNFQISTKFSISIEIFWSGRWCRDEIEISRSRSRYLDRRDLLFDAVETHSLTTSRLRVSIETTSRQIETPRVI